MIDYLIMYLNCYLFNRASCSIRLVQAKARLTSLQETVQALETSNSKLKRQLNLMGQEVRLPNVLRYLFLIYSLKEQEREAALKSEVSALIAARDEAVFF